MASPRVWPFIVFAVVGCSAASEEASGRPVVDAVTPVAPASGAAAPATAKTAAAAAPEPPRLSVENHDTTDLQLYAGYLVDEEGKLGTMTLFSGSRDCADHEPRDRTLRGGGALDLRPPTHAFDEERCAAGRALPPGRYVVHIASGYGGELYAGGAVTLPLTATARLTMERHVDVPPCTPVRARRAARLALAAAEQAGAPPTAIRGCDPTVAACGSLPLPEDEAPPRACAMTLHENLLRIRPAPRADAPSEITSWLDHDLVFARRATVSRSSSAELLLGPDRVVLEGLTEHHLHEHGGAAAKIGSMRVRVFNPTGRALLARPTAVEWLTDHGCGAPKESLPRPAVTGYEPKTLPPGTTELLIQFATRSAYQGHCDVFASRAHLEVEGHDVVTTTEHRVTRMERAGP